ncbi:MAG: carbohydrate binding family 9 domain-containing protein, partial [Bacteroidales bacterium]|nr:carbohydrate binding family 9 domain-containing protein [Bacteroidales bacterium]
MKIYKLIALSVFNFCLLNLGYGKVKDTVEVRNRGVYKRIYVTERISTPPVIDGKLDDECWNIGNWSEDFVQYMPTEGAKASQKTQLKVLYDDKYIYVAFKCYDNEPDKIMKDVGNRDEFVGDIVGINFDSYFDHKTGYEFNITAGGSLIDLIVKSDGQPDFNWNAVWTGKTAMIDSGWTAELKIPFTQLRYNNKPEQVWGMHSWRWIGRKSEEVQWSLIPRNNAGFIYSFGELRGIKDLPASKRIEFMPYTLAKVSTNPVDADNPLSEKTDYNYTVGMDGKIGIGSDFTLDYTLNPDFGQVEADPSEMNLSAFETFYEEKRPFFLEGKSILDYNIDDDILFYSRRIGHSPVSVPDEDESNKKFVKVASNTDILDAVKLSGKTANGLSVAILQSLTNREYALIDSAGSRYKLPADPLTNYMLYRIQKDYNKGNSSLGAIFTTTHRDINHPALYAINRAAYTAGIDYNQFISDRNYFVNIRSLFSSVHGRPEAMLELQQSSVHYFQRPDATYLSIDSTATKLNGYGGKIEFGRTGKNKFSFSESISFRSPGLELNDLGYQQRADFIDQKLELRYHETVPAKVVREYVVNLENSHRWNFGGQHESETYLISSFLHFVNNWQTSIWAYRFQGGLDTRFLRGGPSFKMFPYWHFGMNFNTDWAKPVTFALNTSYSFSKTSNSNDYKIQPQIHLKINSRLRLSSQFSVQENHYDMMYVNT